MRGLILVYPMHRCVLPTDVGASAFPFDCSKGRYTTSFGKSSIHSFRLYLQVHAILHKALEQAVRFNLIPTNPASKVDPPKIRQVEITPLSAEQANRLLNVARDEGNRFEALYVLALTTGLRIGELLGLRWSDTDLDASRLRVSRQVQRGEAGSGEGVIFTEPKAASRRTVDLPQRAVEALRSHRKRQLEEKLKAGGAYQDNALVFATTLGTPLNPETVTQRSFKPLSSRQSCPRYASMILGTPTRRSYSRAACIRPLP
jgi:integrase